MDPNSSNAAASAHLGKLDALFDGRQQPYLACDRDFHVGDERRKDL
jgi:hypothetical protein